MLLGSSYRTHRCILRFSQMTEAAKKECYLPDLHKKAGIKLIPAMALSLLIPARAGGYVRAVLQCRQWGCSSPLSRGKGFMRILSAFFHRSSPRVRGIRLIQVCIFLRDRFIPAHTGDTKGTKRMNSGWTVHPRAHGGYVMARTAIPEPDGSSPRTRGIRDALRHWGDGGRFIPAHTGDTLLTTYGLTTDFLTLLKPPFLIENLDYCCCGSCPRLRWRLHNKDGWRVAVWFIPAYAGDTIPSRIHRFPLPVHPRVYGGHITSRDLNANPWSSSPRVRGRQANDKRFIPAGAGDTMKPKTVSNPRPVHPRQHGGYFFPALLTSSSMRG